MARRRRKQTAKRKNSKFSKAISSLRKMRPNERHDAIRHANDRFIRDLCSKLGKLKRKKLTEEERKFVKKHKSKLKVLCNRRNSIAKKRRMLSQKGGLLPLLAPMIARSLFKLF